MRRLFLILAISVLWMNVGAGLVYADGMILPELLSPDYLVVRYHHVTVSIEDSYALTRVEQEFYNPNPFPVNSQYLFPVPPDAILSRFQATVDGKQQTINRQDPNMTNAALYDMVALRHDPSLLQYADWETLAFDLSLPAGGSRRMSLEYEELLVPSGGLYRYRYVLSTERYSSQPLEQASVTVDLNSSSGLSTLYCATHSVNTERLAPTRARVTWAADSVRPAEDFELFFSPSDGGFGGGLLTGQRAGHDHFLFLFSPEAESLPDDVLSKDIVFVIDRSGSMSGEKMEQARNALHFILGQLNEEDRFSIIGFDHRLTVFSSTLQPVKAELLADARRFVDRLDADGNTDLDAALQAGLQVFRRSESRDASQIVVFLTDGLPTAGVIDEDLIAQSAAQANIPVGTRLHAFGVGYDVNTHLLDRLAADNGGTVTYVQPGENLEAVLTSFYEQIAHPVLTDLEVEFEGLEASALYPSALPDLFRGTSLLLAGRYSANSPRVTVRVRGQAGGAEREYVYRFDVDQDGATEAARPSHDFVPRLWATRRVGELLDRVRVGGENAQLVAEIRDLGLAYGVVTPYTAFAIEAQAAGAASAANMALYDGANQAELNQAWGQTTVQARVQNQLYQQAAQADVARGANVMNSGQHSLAQLDRQHVDLVLLQNVFATLNPWETMFDDPITPEWIERNVRVDRNVAFGSEEYFALAGEPEARPFLQSGTNVVFAYNGEVIAVQDASVPGTQAPARAAAFQAYDQLRVLFDWLVQIVAAQVGF